MDLRRAAAAFVLHSRGAIAAKCHNCGMSSEPIKPAALESAAV
jgi:hypothetical protein